MDAADPRIGLDAAGEGGPPQLTLDGFSGPLDHLLSLARAQKIDLSGLSLMDIIEQLTTALQRTSPTTSLEQKADWLVMAAWLVQLRTRLLLPADPPAEPDDLAAVDPPHSRLVTLEAMQRLAAWLERRPQLGHAAFARGRPELFGVSLDAGPAIDVIEFLWASLALFDDETAVDTADVYQPRPLALYAVAEARERILRRLAEAPDGAPLDRLLPDPPEPPEAELREALRRRLAWSSTLIAGLELARRGEVVLGQGGDFQPIHLRRV